MGCSISGCIIFQRDRSCIELQRVEQRLRDLFIRAEDRGRDSYGIVALQRDGRVTTVKRAGPPSASLSAMDSFMAPETTIVINNDRAEPTTEYVERKEAKDIQPFGETVFVSHNGFIANDKELEKEEGLTRQTRIDSAILPPLLEKLWDGTTDGLQQILIDKILGSFALAVASCRDPEVLFLACNYKPLFLEHDPALDVLFFSSLESYLTKQEKIVWLSNPVRQLDPYSLMRITTRKESETCSLWKSGASEQTRRALVVCSAGLDSTVAAKCMMDKGYRVTLLHFKYRHRAEKREQEAITQIAREVGCDLMFVDTDLFKNVIKHSRLTETYEDVNKERDGEAGAEFAHEWVPARNLIFLSIATGIAEAYGFEIIALGNNLEESGSFPDNEMIFVQKLNEVLPYATNFQKRVRIEMPVGNLMKHEIVRLGVKIGAPLHLTWSCYEGGEYHCGKCGPCYMRKAGFAINGWKDVVQYQGGYS